MVACKRKLEERGQGITTLGQMEKLMGRFGMPIRVKVPEEEKKSKRTWQYFADHFLSQGIDLPEKYAAQDVPDHGGFCDCCDRELSETMVCCTTCGAEYCDVTCRDLKVESDQEERLQGRNSCCFLDT
mmetsp:Transcript_3003/g.4875  ORF Transcript_3003/g.4875 Transcript_3003/m.4875 type:complete len:128 (-) Transcript_3003:75-458(-)